MCSFKWALAHWKCSHMLNDHVCCQMASVYFSYWRHSAPRPMWHQGSALWSLFLYVWSQSHIFSYSCIVVTTTYWVMAIICYVITQRLQLQVINGFGWLGCVTVTCCIKISCFCIAVTYHYITINCCCITITCCCMTITCLIEKNNFCITISCVAS